MRSAVYNHLRLLAFQKNARQLLQYLFILLLSVSAFTYAEVAVDEEVSPWQLSIVGASTGDVLLSGDEQALSLGISEVCVAESQISEEFSSSSSEDLSLLGFQSFGSEALSLLNERATVTAQAEQVLLAPTVLSDSDEITLSAFINSATDSGAGTDSLSIYLTDNEYVGYGVQYQGDGTTGIWALIQFNGADSQSNLAEVAATDNHPTTGQTVTLKRSGDTLTVTVGGTDIGLSYTVNDGIDNLSRYGMRSTSLEASDNNYLDDLTLTFPSNATCPALADTGEWDDAYSLHFVYQELLQQGELIARLSSHSNSGSGIAGIALRNGTAATDKAIALVMDPADNSIGLFTRDTDDAASILTSTGQTGALPQWLRLVRDGDTITAYISTDGESWTQVDSVSISFDDIIKAGIAVAVTGSEAQTLEYDNLSVVNELSGDITSDLELAAHQTYVVTGNVDVNSGVTLTINEGATILFDGNFKIEVNGHLTASGGEYTPVVFTSAQVAPAKGDWYGLVVNSGGSLDLSNTIVEYASYGVYAKSGSTFGVSDSTLQYLNVDGIFVYNASGSISNNTIQYAGTSGIYLSRVDDVTVSDNTITDNKYGFYIKGDTNGVTTPVLTGNTITGNSNNAVYLYGVNNVSYDPQPVITGNSIHSNSGYDVDTYYYFSGGVTINATGNWWNTTDPGEIGAEVYDYSDNTYLRPIVDYSGYLDGEDGTAVPVNGLLGYLTEDMTLAAGTTYTLLGKTYVQSGVTLTIEAGARIESGRNSSLKVSGILDAQGTSDNPIVFTSAETTPSAGDWVGVVATSGSTVNLDHVILEYGNYGLYAGSGSSFSLSNSTLQNLGTDGVFVYNASGSISNNTIQYAGTSGIYLSRVDDVTVSDNTITDNKYGFYIKGDTNGVTTPVLTGNTITGNSNNAVYLYGVNNVSYDPQPVITGNSIHSNSGYDVDTTYYVSGGVTINATGNWWNTTDPGEIGAEVYDYSDNTYLRPIVDYSGYLDGEDGTAVPVNGLLGYLTEDMTLAAGTTYTLLGKTYVQSGTTLTIEAGARIESGGNSSLKVSGTLDAQGTSDNPIVFTSAETTPSAGDWVGVVATSGSTVNLDHVILEYGNYGLYAGSGSSFSLSNSTLQNLGTDGVFVYNASGSISNNTIQYAGTSGIYLSRVDDVAVSDNTITDNKYGFYIKGDTNGVTTPVLTGNTITGNSNNAVYLYGVNNVSYDPQPVITGNSIHSNSGYDVDTTYYVSGGVTINATGNWWNTTDPGEIGAEVYDYSDNTYLRPIVDYSGYLDGEDGTAVPVNGLLGYLTEDMTLAAGTTYTLLGKTYVQSGTTLTIEAGARIESGGNSSLKVSGTLDAQGTSDNPIVFTSAETTPSAGDWVGVVATSGSTVNLDHVILEYGNYGLYAGSGSSFSLSNSTLQNLGTDGVFVYNASGSISNNTIQYAGTSGIYLSRVDDVAVSDNTITDNKYGFYIKGDTNGVTTPVLTGNTITGNSNNAVYLYGVNNVSYDPQPVITGNSIHSNSGYDVDTTYYVSGGVTINATGNWWNTTDPGEIGAEVYDYSDNTYLRPIVDYSGYLDGEDGTAVPVNGLLGYLTEDMTLVAGTTYTLLGKTYVQSGVTLTIEAGARIESGRNSSLKVSGILDAQGTSDNPIVFTSAETTPSAGDWVGVVATSGSTVNLDHVILEYGNYGLYAGSGSSFSLSNSTLQNLGTDGVFVYNASGSISNNTIQYAGTSGIYLSRVDDVTVSDNTITDNKYGFYIKGDTNGVTTPVLTGNTITGNSNNAVYLYGVNNVSYDPQPVITGNSIHSNSGYDVDTTYYVSGGVTINATGNWWNTTDPGEIGAEVYDYSDNTYLRPIVDYSGYLDGEDGTAVPVNGLLGYLTEDMTLVAGTTYTLLGKTYVQSGVTLTIEAGARIESGRNSSLKVSGILDAQGTSDNPIVFTSAETTPSAGDWVGVVATSGSTVNLDHVILEYGNYGLYAGSGSSFSLSNSTLQNLGTDGVFVYNASGSISNNTIQYAGTSGIYLSRVDDVTVSDNTITDNKYGFYIKGDTNGVTTPVLTGNTITGNSNNAVYLYGANNVSYDPQPVITGNSIHSNSGYDVDTYYYVSGGVTINATGNWWNTTDPGEIGAEVYDYSDNTYFRPIVDYSGYLDSASGVPAYDHYLRFDIDSDTTLAAGSYVVVDDINVNSGVSLSVEAGAILVFSAGYSLTVEGDLLVSGSSSQPVLFTSEAQYPAAGDWQGIVVASGGSVSIDNAYVQYAETAVSATSPSAFSVTNSIITNFSESGISINNFSGGTIANNLIQNADYTATGIALDTASPAVTDNIVTGLNYGAYITGASSPSLTGNSFINNNYGIYLNGSGSDATNPTPTIIGNDLYGNANGSLYLNNYGSSSAVVLNVTGNWWGSAAPEWGVDIIGVDSPETAVDYSNALATEIRAITSNLSGNYEYFSPNSDGNQDTLAIAATLSSSSSWSLEVSSESGTVVNSFSGTGTDISIDWDGSDSSSTLLSDGRYYLFLKVTDAENTSYRAGAIWVELDNTAPTVEMSNINDGDILSTGTTTLEIEGSATDRFLVEYTVDYQLSSDVDNWVSLESSTAVVSESTLAEWIVSSTDGTVEAPENGEYQVRLVASDRAGNISTIIRTVTLDLISITNVSRNQTTVNPVAGESLVISFDLSVGATVTLDIKDEQTGVLIRSVVETFDSAGSYSLSWNGRDDEGDYVPEEAYVYFLTAVSGSVKGVYEIEDSNIIGGNLGGSMDSTMNAVQNDFMKIGVTSTENIRLTMEVTPNGGDTRLMYDSVPMESGTHYLAWDGRTADGVLTTGYFYVYIPYHEILPTNVVIIDGINPSISGTLDAPNIEVKSDPYLMYHSYDQISKVAYLLDQDSYVTFKLLPPDIGDPTDAGAITLIDNQLQAANDSDGAVATHEVEWTGYEESDGNAIMVSDEGVYSFWIEATSATTGASTTYYGALQLYQ
ncbi:right-handed parallel beta-helix repeat-containing protein [Microbulbifer sp. SSSA002]|uniref:right-handed parallel beta-helix repeat-containing protein n=1 Tax=Microbulbifer sp. SSSA002 TaxID=3243376 RepID=UPI00403A6535